MLISLPLARASYFLATRGLRYLPLLITSGDEPPYVDKSEGHIPTTPPGDILLVRHSRR